MTYALRTADARFLITHVDSMGVAVQAARNAGIQRERIFLLEGEREGYRSLGELIELGGRYGEVGQVPAFEIPDGKTNADVCGFLSFSELSY